MSDDADTAALPGRPTWPAPTEDYPGAADVTPTFDNELIADDPLAPCFAIKTRYAEIARLHALLFTNKEIAETLGYHPVQISQILAAPFTQREVRRYRDVYFSGDFATKVKELALDGLNLMHRVVLDPAEKMTTRIDVAKWGNEKAYGKARQEVSVESGSLNTFNELLREMLSRGETIDAAPARLVGPAAPASAGEASAETTAERRPDWGGWFAERR